MKKLLISLLVFPVAGCAIQTDIGSLPKMFVPARQVSEALNAVVHLQDSVNNVRSTGYLVGKAADQSYYTLTCYHCIDDALQQNGTIDGMYALYAPLDAGMRTAAVSLVCADKERDLALLKTEPINYDLPVLEICTPERLPEGSFNVFAVGFPEGEYTVFATSRVDSAIIDFSNNLRALSFWKTSDHSYPGQSGSPVLTHDGLVVGTWHGRDWDNSGLCVGLDDMLAFIDENDVEFLLEPGSDPSAPSGNIPEDPSEPEEPAADEPTAENPVSQEPASEEPAEEEPEPVVDPEPAANPAPSDFVPDPIVTRPPRPTRIPRVTRSVPLEEPAPRPAQQPSPSTQYSLREQCVVTRPCVPIQYCQPVRWYYCRPRPRCR